MYTFNVAMEIRPAITSDIATLVRTVISKKDQSVFKDLAILVFNPKVVIGLYEICVAELLETFGCIVSENYHLGFSLSHGLVSPGRNAIDKDHKLDNARKPCSCIVLVIVTSRYGTFGDCKVQQHCVQLARRR